ncbi:hypothetical protein K437DRAFT_257329 [Tilletiaria anomala UBC 951]|uniref:Uncharacterized protein n=1 Tax=Tilletiaria anomala (strain ATCC 24038 / CBS 436.72 / UBC 951) TaxID=1037660 RepID=A0A066VYP5_TILAU|nr:uncharacterized protein K437DRAFT_257329 [Tilletiaria anomala UBC 951]KDN43929.1 hypothetical protein K437DRAFT_257329 [Tilletiaria anomala UBC 951]
MTPLPPADVVSSTHTGALPSQLQQADGVQETPATLAKPASNVRLPSKLERAQIASAWLDTFQQALNSKSIDNVLQPFHEDVYWKGLRKLQWDHH